MDQKWVDKKEQELLEKIEQHKEAIRTAIMNCDRIKDEHKSYLIEEALAYTNEPYWTAHRFELVMHQVLKEDFDYEWVEKFIMKELMLEDFIMNARSIRHYAMFLDSEPMEFDGDIIVTDPCYVVKDQNRSTAPKWEDYMRLPDYRGMTREEMKAVGYFEDYKKLQDAKSKWEEENPDDWDLCACGHEMGEIGLYKCMTRSTIYGDWGCTAYNSDTKEVFGKFCADAGMVGVFDLNEVLEYNPGYNDHIKAPHCVTLIKNFKGTVQFVVEENEGIGGESFSVRVVGRGVNKETGEPLNFITSQTGL